tara:strand:+ start:7343 stop:7888 length:546 start_codon:yes stop_codon:yes gene_type:complete
MAKYTFNGANYSFSDLGKLGSTPVKSGGLSTAEKALIASAALGAGAVGASMVGSSGSKVKAQAGGAVTGALSGALTGASLGSILPGGALLGAGFGAVIGGVTGSVKADKAYTAAKRDAYLTSLGKRKQKYDTAATGRSVGSQAADQARKQYAAATPPMELDVTTMPGVASYDAYKGRTYGG